MRVDNPHDGENIDQAVFDGCAGDYQFMFHHQPFQRTGGFGFKVFSALGFIQDQEVEACPVDHDLVADHHFIVDYEEEIAFI